LILKLNGGNENTFTYNATLKRECVEDKWWFFELSGWRSECDDKKGVPLFWVWDFLNPVKEIKYYNNIVLKFIRLIKKYLFFRFIVNLIFLDYNIILIYCFDILI
jgi:hypothetical protein